VEYLLDQSGKGDLLPSTTSQLIEKEDGQVLAEVDWDEAADEQQPEDRTISDIEDIEKQMSSTESYRVYFMQSQVRFCNWIYIGSPMVCDLI
jgi:hypothetical protein